MRFEEILKEKFLYTKNKNLFKIIYFIVQKLKKNKHRKISYSGGGIDLIIEHYFRNKKKGVYIDVGAYHPVMGNNTFKLFNKGWSGINIDLDFHTIDIFNNFRPNDDNIISAVSDTIEKKKLYFHHNRSAINTLEKNKGGKSKEIREIQTNTLNNIIKNSQYKESEIDFVSIDVEGHEIKVINGFDLKKYSPKIVVIEYQDLDMKKEEFYNQNIEKIVNSNIYKHMINKGYVLVNWLHSDLVFINKKLQDK
jgi:FkbM family methyltransferase